MLGSRSKLVFALDAITVVVAAMRVVCGLEPFSTRPQSHPELRCESKAVDHWELRRLPPCTKE